MNRDDAWSEVWNDRDEETADWNGCEACFDSPAAYQAWATWIAAWATKELALGPDDDVVDLGCGSGRLAAQIAPAVRSVVGLDYSRPALAVAQRTRQLPNVSFAFADLNTIDPEQFTGFAKAVSVGSMLYLSSVERVFDLVTQLASRGVDTFLVDLPDADAVDTRERHYDRSMYSHLTFHAADISARFPGTRIVRGRYPSYANDAVRFSAVIPGDPKHRR